MVAQRAANRAHTAWLFEGSHATDNTPDPIDTVPAGQPGQSIDMITVHAWVIYESSVYRLLSADSGLGFGKVFFA